MRIKKLAALAVFLLSMTFMAAFGTTEVRAEESVDIRVDGIDVGTASSGDGWSCDADTNVLMLDGYVRTFSEENYYGSIDVQMENLTICLKGGRIVLLLTVMRILR